MCCGGTEPWAAKGPIFNASQHVFRARQNDPWGLLAATRNTAGENR